MNRTAAEKAAAAGKQDNIDTCIVCGKEIPPGPDCCSVKCEKKFMQFIQFMQFTLTGKKK